MTVSSPSQLVRVIKEDIGDELRAGMARIVVDAFYDAEFRCDDFRPTTRRDTVGHVRRGLMETRIGALLAAAGHRVLDKANEGGTSYHVEATVGRCVLTVHAVNNVGELPRDANFRFTAAQSAQTDLYARPEPPPPGALIYCHVAYGPRCASSPTFANIIVPNGDCTQIVAVVSMYDELLAARAKRLEQAAQQTAVETVPDELGVTLKTDAQPVYETDFDTELPAATEGVKEHQLSLLVDLPAQRPANEEGGPE